MRTTHQTNGNKILLVPFNVAALYCPEPEKVSRPNADFSKVSYYDRNNKKVINPNMPYISENLVSHPFTNQHLTLERGLHLHFILPHFLRSTVPVKVKDDFDYEFPAIPNRWLVVRNLGKERSKKFLVESDYLYPEYTELQNKVTIPVPFEYFKEKQLKVPFRYIGRQTESGDPKTKSPEYWKDIMEKALTAEGYGDISYTGSYPNCKNILTFHDGEVKDGDTYDIFGYYDFGKETFSVLKPYLDFFRSETGDSQTLKEKFKAFWKLNLSEEPDIGDVNQFMLFSHIEIKKRQKFAVGDKSVKFDIAVGNSGTEAIAAYFEKNLKLPGLENKLEAIQFESLREGTVDLGAKFSEARHRNGFIPKAGGLSFTLDYTITPTGSDDSETNRALKELMKNEALRALVVKARRLILHLNKMQAKYDKNFFRILSKQQQLFADWYKYMLCAHPPYQQDAVYPKADAVLEFLLRSINDDLHKLMQENGLLKTDAATSKPISVNGLEKDSVADKTVRRFAACAEVVTELNTMIETAKREKIVRLLDLNSRITALKAQTGAEEKPDLRVEMYRLEEEIKKYKVFGALNNKKITYNIASIPADRYFRKAEPVIMLAKPKSTHDVFAAPSGTAIIVEDLSPEKILSGKIFADKAWANLREQIQKGTAKSYIPQWLHLDWMADYRPAFDPSLHPDGYEKDFIFELYDLREDSPDFAPFAKKNIPLSDVARRYKGRTLLSTGSPEVLKEKVSAFFRNQEKKDLELEKVLQNLDKKEILTQSLGGFNEALLMRKLTMQLEVTDPIAFAAYKPLIKIIRESIGHEKSSAPEPSHYFNPIQAGVTVIKKLRLLDTFGIETDIFDADKKGEQIISKSDSLKLPNNIKIPSRYFYQREQMLHFPPRFSQAARLNAEWTPAGEKVNTGTEEQDAEIADLNPICGWVMPNFLENTLQIFDRAGEMLGSVGAEDGTIMLIPKPGNTEFFISEIENEHLQNFVKYFYTEATAATAFIDKEQQIRVFTSFLSEIEQALDFIEPQTFAQNQQLSVLTGRPLAIVRVSLNIEIKGEYAVNQDWNIFQKDIYRDVKTIQRSTYHYENVEIPLRIGDFHQLNDGVIGFWYRNLQKGVAESSEDLTGYSSFKADTINAADTFYMPINDRRISKRKRKMKGGENDREFLIGQRLNEAPQVITLLFDPRGVLNVASGILPVKTKTIPAEYYQSALEKMRIYFQMAPVITPYTDLQLALPDLLGANWCYLSLDKIKNKVYIPDTPTISRSVFDRVYQEKTAEAHKNLWNTLTEISWIIPDETDPNKGVPKEKREDKTLPFPFRFFLNEVKEMLQPDENGFINRLTLEMNYTKLVSEKSKKVWEHLLINKRISIMNNNRAYINFNTKQHSKLPDYIVPELIDDIFGTFRQSISDPVTEPQFEQMSVREGWVSFV